MARGLIDAFAQRTGLAGGDGDPGRRYLWTDAFAVQTCFGLAHALGEPRYHQLALELIDGVHEVLGCFHPQDSRSGWISGLPDADARKHPTIAGLRIGKQVPERPVDEPLDDRLEWDRDGQYFHYLTRWFAALSQAAAETEQSKYARWAVELMLAGTRFVHGQPGGLRMYWKMSTDLGRPLVPTMGAHDPLEGLLCTAAAQDTVPDMAAQLEQPLRDFRALCEDRTWATTDALGIGGLLLSLVRAARLTGGVALPQSVAPRALWDDCLHSLQAFAMGHHPAMPASHRLPFRECGLALGLRVADGSRDRFRGLGREPDALDPYLPLADAFEHDWRDAGNRRAGTWTGHLDINAVTLAASLVANDAPQVFG